MLIIWTLHELLASQHKDGVRFVQLDISLAMESEWAKASYVLQYVQMFDLIMISLNLHAQNACNVCLSKFRHCASIITQFPMPQTTDY
jgi:hypothetical protein